MPTIAENLLRLQTARTAIAKAITDKGGQVPTGDGLEEFAADISTIAPYEMTGELPLTFKSDGESLRDYTVYGASQGVGIDDGEGSYIIPIKINNTVVNLPVASKLYEGDILTYADTQTVIPTVDGVNTLDTTLDTKFSMYVNYGEDYPLERLIQSYFNLQRTGKVYQVKIPKYASNNTTVCTKTLDNAGLIAEPSTDSTEGRDDYLDIPLFQWHRCNYVRDSAGVPHITAVEGDNNYSTTDTADVGSFGMSFYFAFDDT